MSTNNPPVNPPTQQQINWVTVPSPGSGQWFTITIGGGGGGGDLSGNYELAKSKKKNNDGCDCKKCKEYFPYAEPNQDDGTLVCYKCRIGW